MKTSADPADMDWGYVRAAKRFVDDKMSREVRTWASTNLYKRFLTLPASEWLWERTFARTFPGYYVFDGVERDTEVHRRAVKVGRHITKSTPGCEFKMVDTPVSLESYLRYRPLTAHPYDMIYLDWMGTWSTKKLHQVENLFKRRMFTDDSYFRYTISMNRGRAEQWEEKSADAPRVKYHDVRCGDRSSKLAPWLKHGVPHLICSAARRHGYAASVAAAFVYLSHSDFENRGVAEVSVLIKINGKNSDGRSRKNM